MSSTGDDDSLLSGGPRRARPVPAPEAAPQPPAAPQYSPPPAPQYAPQQPPQQPPPTAPQQDPPAAPPADPRRVQRPWSRRRVLLVAVPTVLALLVVGVVVVRALIGTPVALEVDGAPIVNAQQMLDDAGPQLVAVADDDGAPLPEGAGCWFAPAEQEAISPGPRVACGPVRLGIAGDDQLWLVATPSYSGTDEVRGTVGELDEVAALDLSTLNRPDGDRPPSDAPAIGTEGVRTEGGQVLANVEAYLAEADRQLEDVAAAEVSVAEGARCFLGVREVSRAGETVRQATGSTWCGPARTRAAAPGASWAELRTSVSGTGLVTAELGQPTLTISASQAVPSGTLLWRPDGAEPAEDGDLAAPVAGAQPPGFADVVAELAEPDGLTAPADGRLRTPREDVRLTGLARVPQVGEGDAALVAAEGEELVVARYEVAVDPEVTGRSTATLVVDGERRPLRPWSSLEDGSWLVVSVPTGADAVDLEVLFDDRAQTISLLTGERAPGAPAALYRGSGSVGVGSPLQVAVPLPEGDPGTVSLVVTEAVVAAWLPDQGWAPEGRAYVRLALEQVEVEEPCCDVRGLEVVPVLTLTPSDGTAVPTLEGTDPVSDDAAVFVVAQDVAAATLTLTAAATFEGGTATSPADSLPLELPR